MNIMLFAGLALAASVAIAGTPAAAATLTSTSISIAGNNSLQCRIVNVADSARAISVTMYASTGAVLWTSGTFTLGPHEAASDTADLAVSKTGSYCAFAVSGSARDYRAAAESTQSGVGAVAIAPAN